MRARQAANDVDHGSEFSTIESEAPDMALRNVSNGGGAETSENTGVVARGAGFRVWLGVRDDFRNWLIRAA
jgi:hypothetical protein